MQLVESVRMQGKVKQKIIKHLGVAYDEKQLDDLKSLAQILKEKLENTPQFNLFAVDDLSTVEAKNEAQSPVLEQDDDFNVDLRALEEQGRIVNGIHDELFDELNLKSIFKSPSRNINTLNVFKQIVMARIANPDSKRASVKGLEEQFGISLNLDQVYRMMDKIDDNAIESLNEVAYRETKRLFNEKIDVIFFDVQDVLMQWRAGARERRCDHALL